jgi:hypothetical protein
MTAQDSVTFGSVPMSVSMPEALSFHMILDHELSQLTLPEAGVLGSLGFVFLGGVLGLIPGFVTAIEKANTAVFTNSDLATVIAFCVSGALALACLCISGLRWARNRGLAATIRARSKHGFTFADHTSVAATART